MNPLDCYRVLGLPPTANLGQLKQAYRRLARHYHPDSNRTNPRAQETFILIHQAYQTLRPLVPAEPPRPRSTRPGTTPPRPITSKPTQVKHPDAPRRTHPTPRTDCTPRQNLHSQTPQTAPEPTPQPTEPSINLTPPGPAPKEPQRKPPKSPELPNLEPPTPTPFEIQLKKRSYQQLQELLRYRRFQRAAILIEGLRQILAEDIEVRQWQGITYHCWARDLIQKGQSAQACHFLNLARQADPQNYALAQAISRDFQQLERRFPKRQLVAI